MPAHLPKWFAGAGNNRHGHRDATMILMAFRHGLRASELCSCAGSKLISSMAACTSIGLRMGCRPSIH